MSRARQLPNPFRQRGFSIITALFLLVILSLLGALMITLSTTQQVSSVLDVQGTQAFRAARAGIEWGIGRASGGNCVGSSTLTIESHTVLVTCSSSTFDEAGTSRMVYRLEATASRGGSAGSLGFIERNVYAYAEF
jgi:MSHA biogenesis protein MshP